jgi:hypothetical protein
MTLLELIRLRLSEAEKEPITPSESMIIDAVDALSDYVECQAATTGADTRRQLWCAAYLTKLGTSTMRGELAPECRTAAKIAALEAVVDYDAFVAAEVPA